VGSTPTPANAKQKQSPLWRLFLFLWLGCGVGRERGRESGNFPVAEILKPMDFRTQSRLGGTNSESSHHRKKFPKTADISAVFGLLESCRAHKQKNCPQDFVLRADSCPPRSLMPIVRHKRSGDKCSNQGSETQEMCE